MNYPEPDNFDDIYIECNSDLIWNVVGHSKDYSDGDKYIVIAWNLMNKQIAEAFLRVYTDNYIRGQFFSDGPSDA